MEGVRLLQEARRAANNAYTPYSNFRVGAVVLCSDGTLVKGCNVENASYGLTVCAERVALFSAIAMGKKPKAIAVSCVDVGGSSSVNLRMPCGACRQVMMELLPDDAEVLIDGAVKASVGDLLPKPFKLEDLGSEQ